MKRFALFSFSKQGIGPSTYTTAVRKPGVGRLDRPDSYTLARCGSNKHSRLLWKVPDESRHDSLHPIQNHRSGRRFFGEHETTGKSTIVQVSTPNEKERPIRKIVSQESLQEHLLSPGSENRRRSSRMRVKTKRYIDVIGTEEKLSPTRDQRSRTKVRKSPRLAQKDEKHDRQEAAETEYSSEASINQDSDSSSSGSDIQAQKLKIEDSEEETIDEKARLVDGVAIYGAGNWAQIVKAFEFHKCRTSVSLKDKWRNLLLKKQREKNNSETSGDSKKTMHDTL